MSIDPINIGGQANDSSGQSLRSGGALINANFAELDLRTATAQETAEQGVADAATAQAKADEAIPASALGSTVAQLVAGTVPASQLPSFVDDVLEFATLAAFPDPGETGKIYIAINDGDSPSNPTRQYRWSGTAYVMIPSSPGSSDQVPEGATNLYHTAARVRAVVLAGLGALTDSAITATDSILQAFAKLQGQINEKLGKTEKAADSDKLNGQVASFYTATMTGATASVDGMKGLVPAPLVADRLRFLRGDGTWVTLSSSVAWGGITGSLSAQTDLQAALDAKQTKPTRTGELALTTGGAFTIAHGMTPPPTDFNGYVVCKVAEGGFAVGDLVKYSLRLLTAQNADIGMQYSTDATTITVRQPAAYGLMNKSTGAGFALTLTSWRVIIEYRP
jgi:hypothetical protein